MPILEVKSLSAVYDREQILSGVSFSLEKGDTLSVIGPNGSGKTTFFRALLGAIPYGGEIIWHEPISIGYVPQKIDLERDLPLTIAEFFDLKKMPGVSESYESILASVGLSQPFLKKRISDLSSGEFQRVLIAWAIIGKPSVLLFDEPTASVDVAGQETVYELLHRLQDLYNLTLILISHDLTVVYRYSNKVLCLNRKQICFGDPSSVLTPEELERLYGGGRKFYHHLHEGEWQ